MYGFVAAAVAAAQGLVPAPGAVDIKAPIVGVAEAAPATCCVLGKLTPVVLTIEEAVESDKVAIGQRFAIRLAEPLTVGGGLVIPAGASGVGEVVHAAKSRAMGKPGELLLAARYLDWNGTRIPLRSLRFGKPQGQDNATTAAIVGIAVSSLLTPFITGGEVRIPAGASAWAKVAEDVSLAAPDQAAAAAPAGPTATAFTTEPQPGGKE